MIHLGDQIDLTFKVHLKFRPIARTSLIASANNFTGLTSQVF
jgi:hypothetical protein